MVAPCPLVWGLKGLHQRPFKLKIETSRIVLEHKPVTTEIREQLPAVHSKDLMCQMRQMRTLVHLQ